jgi:TPR repeat protein
MEEYYSCCGKSICRGCLYSFRESGNNKKCTLCNADQGKTGGERVDELMGWVNDAGAMTALGRCYIHGAYGLLQD